MIFTKQFEDWYSYRERVPYLEAWQEARAKKLAFAAWVVGRRKLREDHNETE